MENKKNEDKRIERRIPMHFLIGLNVALLLTLAAFEWKTEVPKIVIPGDPVEVDKWDEPPMTIQKTIPPKPKPTKPEFKEVEEEVIQQEELEDLFEEEIETETETFEQGDFEFEPEPMPVEVADVIHDIVEVQPEYAGGWSAFYKFVGKNTKYPNAAKRVNLEGKVFIEFIIEKDGTITNFKVVRGLGAGCEEETIRVLQMLPDKFEPARINGKPVRKRMQLPFSFKLN